MLVLTAMMFILTLEDTSSFAERVERETGHFCERKDDGSLGCWPGRVQRADGVYGYIWIDFEGEQLKVIFPDGTVDGLPEGSRICEQDRGALICHDVGEEEVNWTAIASRYRE
tara:strand:- start:8568 stop:8906 length:339 start_codon:yes stop_codon:yes gene_type:complete